MSERLKIQNLALLTARGYGTKLREVYFYADVWAEQKSAREHLIQAHCTLPYQ